MELTERYDTVMFNIQLQLQRHGYHTIFLYFVADYPLSHIHAKKKTVFAFFQKRSAREVSLLTASCVCGMGKICVPEVLGQCNGGKTCADVYGQLA